MGDVIAPTLFAIFIAALLHRICNELPLRILILYGTDGRLFNMFPATDEIFRHASPPLRRFSVSLCFRAIEHLVNYYGTPGPKTKEAALPED